MSILKRSLAILTVFVLICFVAGCNGGKTTEAKVEETETATQIQTDAETQAQTEKETQPPTEDTSISEEKDTENLSNQGNKDKTANESVDSSISVADKKDEFPATYYIAVDYAAFLAIDKDGATFFNGVMETIPRGTGVQVLGKETAKHRSFDGTETYVEYYRVKYNGNEGYVSVEELTK